MLKLSLCALVISILVCHVSVGAAASHSNTTTTVKWLTTRGTTTPVPTYPGAATRAPCQNCPPCPAGYGYTSSMGSCECLCRWYGNATTAVPTGNSNSLLLKLLTNIGSNAGSIADMATALQEELQIAQGLA